MLSMKNQNQKDEKEEVPDGITEFKTTPADKNVATFHFTNTEKLFLNPVYITSKVKMFAAITFLKPSSTSTINADLIANVYA